MSKLFKYKQWLTIPEAASRLTLTFEEEVMPADILRLALDGHLILSVNFVNHTYAKRGKIVGLEGAIWRNREENIFFKKFPEKFEQLPEKTIASLQIDEDRFINIDESKIVKLCDVYDLAMLGNERLDIEHYYQQLTGGPEITLTGLDGAFVTEDEYTIYQLQDSFDRNPYQKGSQESLKRIKEHIVDNNLDEEKASELIEQYEADRKEYLDKKYNSDTVNDYYPAGGLPDDTVLVVRTKEINRFEKSMLQSTDAESQIKLPNNEEPIISLVRQSDYWQSLNSTIVSIINDYPEWKSTQRKIQKTGNLMDWLTNSYEINKREAEIIKKILSDFFQELN